MPASHSVYEFLRKRWDQVWSGLRTDEAFNRVMAAYDERGRHYHSAEHIYNCLKTLDSTLVNLVDLPDELAGGVDLNVVVLGLFMHDLFYVIGWTGGKNEERSSFEMFSLLSEFGVKPTEFHQSVKECILATQHLGVVSAGFSAEAKLVCDVDLSLFGTGSFRDMWLYEDQIHAEFLDYVADQHLEVTNKNGVYFEKRMTVLMGLSDLARSGKLYYFFNDIWGARARENLSYLIGLVAGRWEHAGTGLYHNGNGQLHDMKG